MSITPPAFCAMWPARTDAIAPRRIAAIVMSRERLWLGRRRKGAALSLLLRHFGGCEGRVVESLRTFAHDPAADEAFERTQGALIFGCDETDSVAHGVGAARPANAVDVVFRVLREVVIDDMGDAVHIN